MHHYVRSALGNSHLQKTTVLSLIVAAMVLCWQQLADIEVLPIEVVQIKGEFKFLSREDLKQRAMPYVQGGFFSVDLKTIRRALIDLPWVEDVSVRRQWPNELSVRVIEKQAVAFWGQDGLLSSRANLFRPKKIYRHLNLPKIYGPEGQHEFMLQELAKMQAWLAGTELVITEIKQDARRSWVLSLLLTASEVSMPAMELRLGRDQQHERLHRFVDIYQRHLKKYKQKIRHIDMRYTNGFAVAWQNQEA
jgi:cell division protein FtsQ